MITNNLANGDVLIRDSITHEQNLILQAILATDPKHQIDYYKKWSQLADLDSIDGGSYRLIPMLYDKIKAADYKDENQGRFKGIYKYYLFKNSMIFQKFNKTAKALSSSGIRVMALKGICLILSYYDDKAQRPMNDIDIMVDRINVKNTVLILEQLGWKRRNNSNIDDLMQILHSTAFASEDGFELDLHWDPLFIPYQPDIWKDSKTIDYMGVDIYIPCHEDQIILNCVHSIMWNIMPPIRWIADVVSILRKCSNEINWDRLIKRSIDSELAYFVYSCMKYVSCEYECPIPAKIIDDLSKLPVKKDEAKIFYTLMLPHSTLIWKRVQWMIHKRRTTGKSLLFRLYKYPSVLKTEAGYDTYRGYIKKIFISILR